MKKIGLIMVTINSVIMENVYEGIKAKCREYGNLTLANAICPSVTVSEQFNNGEFAVFNDIDYSDFDGLVVALNTIISPEIKDYINQLLENFNKPIVAIDCEVPNAYKISTSNYLGMKECVDHLIDVHGCKKINCITGPDDNGEAIERFNAYKDSLKAHGLPVEDDRVFHGTFYVQDGADSLAYYALSDNASDFDAIVCANDMAAISVTIELKKRGKRIPEDVMVTGFDGIKEGGYCNPPITTVVKPEFEIGCKAIELLNNLIEGKKCKKITTIPCKAIFRESCGCNQNIDEKNKQLNRLILGNFISDSLSKDLIMMMQESLADCDTYIDYFHELKNYIRKMNPYGFYFLLKKSTCEKYDDKLLVDDDEIYEVPIAYVGGKFQDVENLKQKELIDKIFENGEHSYVCAPVHYSGNEFGYVFFIDSDFPISDGHYYEWIRIVSNSINSLRDRILLKKAIKKLEGMYIKDQMTDLYNRYGLEKYFEEYREYCDENMAPLMIMFVDVNGLKYVNDNFGHENGDFVIKEISGILKEVSCEGLAAVRFGGDEFLLIGRDCSEEKGNEITHIIHNRFSEVNKEYNKPFLVSASTGFYIKQPRENISMKQCIKNADTFMYKEKVKYHKKNRK